ncbi:MAG: methyltransferase domain-containing protein [Myxococcota bacterium]|nr:methyltransferase domain-containing protein [Myxococcota bacterium]
MTAQGVRFDAAAARGLEAAYQTIDVILQRVRVLDALALSPGDHVLDIGCGPGLLLEALAKTVSPSGRAVGMDQSSPMVDVASHRCEVYPQATLEVGEALDLPYPDQSFDAVVSTQVYEYVADIPSGLQEIRRVLRPGARVVLLDTDYDSLVVHTEDPERLARILEAWDEHFVHRGLPRTLGAEMKKAGLRVRRVESIPMLNVAHHEDAFSWHLTRMMAGFSAGRGDCTEEDTRNWLAELERLGEAGEYFFSLNRYLFAADREALPGEA